MPHIHVTSFMYQKLYIPVQDWRKEIAQHNCALQHRSVHFYDGDVIRLFTHQDETNEYRENPTVFYASISFMQIRSAPVVGGRGRIVCQ